VPTLIMETEVQGCGENLLATELRRNDGAGGSSVSGNRREVNTQRLLHHRTTYRPSFPFSSPHPDELLPTAPTFTVLNSSLSTPLAYTSIPHYQSGSLLRHP